MSTEFEDLMEAFSKAKEATENLSKSVASADAPSMANGPSGQYALTTTTGTGTGIHTFGPTYGGTLGGVPSTFPSTSTFDYWPVAEVCPMGHVADSEDIEYVDGVIVSHCITCHVRMQMNKVSGGQALIQIQHLLGRVMSIDDETRELEGFDLGQILADFSEIRDNLEKDEFAMRQARKLFDLASQVLNTKVSSEE